MISPSSLSAFSTGVAPAGGTNPLQRVRDADPAPAAQRTQPPPQSSIPATPPTQFTPRGSFLNLSV